MKKDMVKLNIFMALQQRKRQEEDQIRNEEISELQLILEEEKKAEVNEQ